MGWVDCPRKYNLLFLSINFQPYFLKKEAPLFISRVDRSAINLMGLHPWNGTIVQFFQNNTVMKRVILILIIIISNTTLFSCTTTDLVEESSLETLATEGEDGTVEEENSEDNEG